MSDGLLDVWPPLPPRALARSPIFSAPFPLDRSDCALFARARQAIFHGLGALGVGSNDEVLVPAYHHGSEIEAILRSGAVPRFYAGDARLAPDEDELEALTGPRTRALYVTHYLGFPQASARWRSWCDQRDLALIEDAAQSWLAVGDGGPVGSEADLTFFSLYKTVGLADGAAALCRAPLPRDRSGATTAAGPWARRVAAWAEQRSGSLASLRARQRGDRPAVPFDPQTEFSLGDENAPASRPVKPLLRRLVRPGVAEARRRNYRQLLAGLKSRVPAPFDELPAGACPWAIPVQTTDKPDLLATLAGARIRALDLWSAPHPSLPIDRFEDAASRRASTVGLPAHQELGRRDLERILEATLSWFEDRGG